MDETPTQHTIHHHIQNSPTMSSAKKTRLIILIHLLTMLRTLIEQGHKFFLLHWTGN